MSNTNSKSIAQQNDLFRSDLGVLPTEIPLIKEKYLVSSEFCDLQSRDQIAILSGVRKFNEFNDPYAERDFGKFTVNGHDVIWKIDYFDAKYEYDGSHLIFKPAKTRRVLTLMLAHGTDKNLTDIFPLETIF